MAATTHFRFRNTNPRDIGRALHLIEQDRALFSPGIWRLLPRMLPDLVERERVISMVVEDVHTQAVCFLGMSAFVDPPLFAGAVSGDGLVRNHLFELVHAGRHPFLSRRQIAAANGRGELILFHLFGCPDDKDFRSPRGFELHRMGFEGFAFYHGGYRIQEFWQEAVVPEAALFVASMGVPEVRPQRPTPDNGPPARLFRFTRGEATANPGIRWPLS